MRIAESTTTLSGYHCLIHLERTAGLGVLLKSRTPDGKKKSTSSIVPCHGVRKIHGTTDKALRNKAATIGVAPFTTPNKNPEQCGTKYSLAVPPKIARAAPCRILVSFVGKRNAKTFFQPPITRGAALPTPPLT